MNWLKYFLLQLIDCDDGDIQLARWGSVSTSDPITATSVGVDGDWKKKQWMHLGAPVTSLCKMSKYAELNGGLMSLENRRG